MSFNERTKHFFINIYLSFYSRKGAHCLLLVWEIDIYSKSGLLFVPYLLSVDRGCQRLHRLAPYRLRRPNASAQLRVPRSTPHYLPLSKSDRVVITWSPSGYTPVGPDCPDALSSPCLLIPTWQFVKAQEVTRNEPKTHVICYLTCWASLCVVLYGRWWEGWSSLWSIQEREVQIILYSYLRGYMVLILQSYVLLLNTIVKSCW